VKRWRSNDLATRALLLLLDAYPTAPKVVRDGLDEAVSEAAVGVFRIIGVEGEALVAEDLDDADPLYRFVSCEDSFRIPMPLRSFHRPNPPATSQQISDK
jgi:hypothetical protein